MAQERAPRYDEQVVASEAGQAYTYPPQLRPLETPRKQPTFRESEQAAYSSFQKTVIMRSMKLFSVIVTVFIFAVVL